MSIQLLSQSKRWFMADCRMKLLTKQQALKAYLAGYTIVYDDNGKFKQVNQNTRLNASNEYYVLGC